MSDRGNSDEQDRPSQDSPSNHRKQRSNVSTSGGGGGGGAQGPCCFYMKYGKCEPPRGSCRFQHIINPTNDDGVTPCCFGATCRLGHASRVLSKDVSAQNRLEYWQRYNNNDNNNNQTSKCVVIINDNITTLNNNNNNNNNTNDENDRNASTKTTNNDDDDATEEVNNRNNNNHDKPHVEGISPAVRDATKLRSQLEPWPTATLRHRLVAVFGERYVDWDGQSRGAIMSKLLDKYEESGLLPRKVLRIEPPSRELPLELQNQLLTELRQWRLQHPTNVRPSINAESYMILRSPAELQQHLQKQNNAKKHGGYGSKSAYAAAKKLQQFQQLWDLATTALEYVVEEEGDDVDEAKHFAKNFSALAVTYNFQGSPHIDKQNTTPFYGLSLGDVPKFGGGEVCVEVDPFTVAHVNTKNKLGKVDGRYPHWVNPYDTMKHERYSLIYYSTWQTYEQPKAPYFGTIV